MVRVRLARDVVPGCAFAVVATMLLVLVVSGHVARCDDDVRDDLKSNPIYVARDHMKMVRHVKNAVLFSIDAPNNTHLDVLHVYGDAYERGYAQGLIYADEISAFVNQALIKYYDFEIEEFDVSFLPKLVVDALKKMAEHDAPGAAEMVLTGLDMYQYDYNAQSKSKVLTEIDAMAQGVCDAKECHDVDEWQRVLRAVNMFPELIRMACSMAGAWGDASPSGHLTQLRSLDFGGGPYATETMMTVHHPTDSDFPFALIGFPGFAGAVTSFSKYTAQSEKVLYTTQVPLKGTYFGQAIPYVIRDVTQFAKSSEEAVQMLKDARRTWHVWLGYGDKDNFTPVSYTHEELTPYTWMTISNMTSNKPLKDVSFINKHVQPSADRALYNVLSQLYGKLDGETMAKYVPLAEKSGDVHLAVYDFNKGMTYVAKGVVNANGDFTRKAYESPVLSFINDDLWNSPPMSD